MGNSISTPLIELCGEDYYNKEDVIIPSAKRHPEAIASVSKAVDDDDDDE